MCYSVSARDWPSGQSLFIWASKRAITPAGWTSCRCPLRPPGRVVIRMTERQKRFVDYYIKSGNATEAARKAGYSEKYTNNNAQKILRNTTVQNAITGRIAEMQSERIADAEEVLTYLTAAMRGEIKEEVIVVEGLGNGESSARVETKQLSAATRTKAAELLAKRYGLLVDKKEIAGAGGGPLNIRWMSSPDEKVENNA